MQFRLAVNELQGLEREFPLQVRKHDVAGPRFNGPVNHQDVALENTGIDHGVASGLNDERRIAVFHEVRRCIRT